MSDVFGGNVVTRSGVELPRLVMKDIDSIRSRAREGIKAHVEALIPKNFDAYQRLEVLRVGVPPYISARVLGEYVNTNDGAKAVLVASLKKGGKADAEASEIVDGLSYTEAIQLASEVLFGESEPAPQAPVG
jgi:hypothetical protein